MCRASLLPHSYVKHSCVKLHRKQLMPSALMNVPQLKEFCRGFPGATETLYEEPYNFLVYAVGGKKFAYFKN